MVQSINTCPPHWSPRCHPRPCDVPKPVEPAKPQPTATTTVHNVLYLVDEHDITGKPAGFVPARDFDTPTLRARYAWHHGVANLTTFNVPELPDTIKLHEMIGNPKLNKNFRWEGFMFDIPGGDAACRVAIAAGADKASNDALSTGKDMKGIDRVVGFAGIYPDNKVPLGPIVQVRRDDFYRVLGKSLNDPKLQLAWHCAYYITKDTPKAAAPDPKKDVNNPLKDGLFLDGPAGNPDEAPPADNGTQPAEERQDKPETTAYDAMMDENIADDVATVPDAVPYGGYLFGFTTEKLDQGTPEALAPFKNSAIDDLLGK